MKQLHNHQLLDYSSSASLHIFEFDFGQILRASNLIQEQKYCTIYTTRQTQQPETLDENVPTSIACHNTRIVSNNLSLSVWFREEFEWCCRQALTEALANS